MKAAETVRLRYDKKVSRDDIKDALRTKLEEMAAEAERANDAGDKEECRRIVSEMYAAESMFRNIFGFCARWRPDNSFSINDLTIYCLAVKPIGGQRFKRDRRRVYDSDLLAESRAKHMVRFHDAAKVRILNARTGEVIKEIG